MIWVHGMAFRCDRGLILLAMVVSLGLGGPALAETPSVMVELSVSSQTPYDSVLRQAEAMARAEVARYFNQHPDSAAVEVVVLGERNGNIVPILSATVSRAEWRPQAPAQDWARLFAAHSFFDRGNADAGNSSDPVSALAAAPGPLRTVADIDRAFDEGRLSPVVAQQYLSYLD